MSEYSYRTYNDDVNLVLTINICGCGTPNVCYKWLIEYLTDLENKNWDKYDYDSHDWKYIQIINGYLEELGFVEHSVTCRCSWLTPQGEKVLEILRILEKNNFDFNPSLETEYGKWFWVEKEVEE